MGWYPNSAPVVRQTECPEQGGAFKEIGEGVCCDVDGKYPDNFSKNGVSVEECKAEAKNIEGCVGVSHFSPARRCSIWSVGGTGSRPAGFNRFEGTGGSS